MLNEPEATNPIACAMNYAGRAAEDGQQLGIPSGLAALDELITHWRKSSLAIIAGAPSMGCTALLLACMRHTVQNARLGAAFFSLQQRSDKLLAKWMSQELGVCYTKIETGQLTEAEEAKRNDFVKVWERSAGPLAIIDDFPNPTIGRIVNRCKRLRASGTELFLIDDINRIALGKKARAFCSNREQELASIVRRLKTLAYELDAPVLVVSQLSRAASDRSRGSRPQLTDLRDSGALENEADVVVLLYRPELYQFVQDSEGNPTAGRAELIVAKNAFGKTGIARVRFRAEIGLFEDIEAEQYAPDADKEWHPDLAKPLRPFAPNSIRLGSKINQVPEPLPKSTFNPFEEPPF